VEGGKGIFDVMADDEILFSKDRVGRFPEHSEVLDTIRTRV